MCGRALCTEEMLVERGIGVWGGGKRDVDVGRIDGDYI
jgi:hypothetical protein